jgi:predicted acyl esterase
MGDVGNGDDAYHNGAFHLAANFGFYSGFKPHAERPPRTLPFDYGTPDQYDFYLRMGPISNANEKYLKNQNGYWNDILQHDTYDEFWQSRTVTASLLASTSGTDADFVVKLIDVYPDDYPDPAPNPKVVHMAGYQQLVRGEPIRGKFRNSLSKPEPFTHGKAARIEFAMPDICHTFCTGHRIMVQLTELMVPAGGSQSAAVPEHPPGEGAGLPPGQSANLPGGAEGSRLCFQVVP